MVVCNADFDRYEMSLPVFSGICPKGNYTCGNRGIIAAQNTVGGSDAICRAQFESLPNLYPKSTLGRSLEKWTRLYLLFFYGIEYIRNKGNTSVQPTLRYASDADIQSAVESARNEVRYLVTDYPIETLIRKYKSNNPEEGDIYIPEYQRTLQWDDAQKSYFIESILLRIPVPPVFFYEISGRLEIVDGSQRIRTLVEFYNNKFNLVDLEKLDVLNGMNFSDIPSIIKKRFLNSPIRSFVLEETTDQSSRVELFRRVNTSSKQLTEAEIRKGAYQGRFLDLVVDCASRESFKALAPGTGSRGNKNPESERQELVTRFFVYSLHYQSFVHDVRRFLDDHFKRLNETISDQEIKSMSDEFDRVMEFISTNMPEAFFRAPRTKQVPRVRFEAIAVGVCLALKIAPNLEVRDMRWLDDPEFLRLIRTDASNSGPRLRARVEFVRDSLLQSL